ncbi:metallopeptidase [Patescibacteria group bacterium]|nr:metallopeptidase [Patescibacteria group bacterium]
MKRSSRVDWAFAPDVKKRVLHLSKKLDLEWLKASKIYCFRSNNSKSRAYARIWGLTRIWQIALDTKPAYVIEVLSEKFDGLSQDKQDTILLHELAHIPKNFSGSLLPHIRKRGKRNFDDRVQQLIARYKRKQTL